MKRILIILHNLVVISCLVPYTLAVINVTLTGTTTQHVCKGEDIDFKWSYDDTDPDKDFIKTIHWSKDPSGYLIMQYKTDNSDLSITSSPNDYTGRVERTTTEAGSNDIGMRLKQAGATAVDDDGKYYVSLIVDKPGGDGDDYFVPYRDPQGVQVYVCIGVDDTFPLPSLSLTYDETTHVITCSGPSTLGDTTFAIFYPDMNIVVESTTDVTITKDITAERAGGTYICKTYCTEQGFGDTPQGTCLPTDATLVMPSWSAWTWTSVCTGTTSRTAMRVCDNPAPVPSGPQNCPGDAMKTELCPTPPPPPGPCSSNPCQNGGTCKEVSGGFRCYCELSYAGTTCAEIVNNKCDPNPCRNQGTCSTTASGYSCLCGGLWEGTTCTQLVTETKGNCYSDIQELLSDSGIMLYRTNVSNAIPCTSDFQINIDECFNVTAEMLPLVTNDRRRKRSAVDRASSPGFSLNIIDENNFDMIYFRTDDQNCLEVASFVDGTFETSEVNNDCGEYRIATDWFRVELHICNTTVLLMLNGSAIQRTFETRHPFTPSLGLVQGPPYNDECSQDCRFQFRNLSVYPAFDPQTTVEMDGFCSSPIKGGCLALIIVFIIIYLIIVVYVLILICYTFVKGVDDFIPIWLKIILIVVVIILPVIGAIIVVVYVYIKHCGKNKEEHSGKYFVFKCPCRMEANGRQSPLPPKPYTVSPSTENSTQVPPKVTAFSDSKSTKKRGLPPLNGDTANTDSSKQTKQTIEYEDVDTNKQEEEKEAQEEQERRKGREGGECRNIIKKKEDTSENSAQRNSYESVTDIVMNQLMINLIQTKIQKLLIIKTLI